MHSHTNLKGLLATALFATLCTSPSVRAGAQNPTSAPRYIVIDLGVTGTFTSSAGYGLNASGQAAGNLLPTSSGLGYYTDTKGKLHALGTLRADGSGTSQATGINNTGWVIGAASSGTSANSGQLHAFMINTGKSGSAMIDLTPGLVTSFGEAINQFNEVVGSAGQFAFFYTPGAGGILTPLFPTDAASATAFGIADDAKIVGTLATTVAKTAFNAFLTDSHGVGLADLGTLGGTNSTARGINVSDQVVGGAELATQLTHAFRTAAGGSPIDPSLASLGGSDLGVLTGKGYTGKNSYALGINAAGQVVGFSDVNTTSPPLQHAFIYDDINGMRDLNQLIPAINPNSWVLNSATAINDNGEIVGFGTLTVGGVTVTHAFELVRNPIASLVISPMASSGGFAARGTNELYDGGTATGTVVLQQPAPAGGVTVKLSSSDSALLPVPAPISVAAGSTSATFTITGSGAGAVVTNVTITATTPTILGSVVGGTASDAIQVIPIGVQILSAGATTMNPGTTAQGTIVLNAPAPSGSFSVKLSVPAGSPISVQSPVTMTSGAVSAAFTITDSAYGKNGPTPVTITATFPAGTATATVTALGEPAITGMTLSPATINGLNSTTGTITISQPAAPGGIKIPLTCSPGGVASPDATCNIAAGAVSGQFNVNGQAVTAAKTATVSATWPGKPSVVIHVDPKISPTRVNNTLFIDPNPLPSGGSATATFTGTSASGENATLTSSDPTVTVPSYVTLGTGLNTVNFTVTSTAPVAQQRSVTITASYSGGNVTRTLVLLPTTLAALAIAPASLVGGVQVAIGTATLSGPAPPGGLYVYLSSNDAAAAVPSYFLIGGGATSGTFTLTTAVTPGETLASISALTLDGTKLVQKVAIQPITATSLTIASPTVTGQGTLIGTVTLNSPAPPGGIYVYLNSSDAAAAVPAYFLISGGATSGSFNITTSADALPTLVTITAIVNIPAKLTATLTVSPITAEVLALSSDSGYGGVDTITGTVTLNTQAPAGGIYVYLYSSDTSDTPPTYFLISGGATNGTFTVSPTAVVSPIQTGIWAGTLQQLYGSAIPTELFGVLPCQVARLTVNQSTIAAGGTATATLLLSHVCPPGGQYVYLLADDPTVTVPNYVLVPGSTNSVTFTVTAGLLDPGFNPVTIYAYPGPAASVETSVQLTIH